MASDTPGFGAMTFLASIAQCNISLHTVVRDLWYSAHYGDHHEIWIDTRVPCHKQGTGNFLSAMNMLSLPSSPPEVKGLANAGHGASRGWTSDRVAESAGGSPAQRW